MRITVVFSIHLSRTSRGNKLRERGPNGSPRSWTDSPCSSPKAGPSSAADEDTSAGYNSGDEYGANCDQISEAEWIEVSITPFAVNERASCYSAHFRL